MEDDIVRFLVSTDNHLGYAERDPIRGNDSFAAFEEVLRTAIAKKVDFVLLAGDMFHENKPSRKTMHSTMELLRRYCLGSDSIFIEILNDQRELFRATMGQVNYEDPYQAIRLPIFAIHGNHDDPSREGGTGDALAALDLLAVSNYINYYGKADRVEDIEITPILICKANTKIALYGLGAMRDERLNRMWNQKKVKFVRLTEAQGRDEYYNIFVLHQNRDYGRGKKNCVHESMIPEWMDLVIWGNEHECQPNLAESLVGTYRILQPGSSVACSLSSTESASCPKHMALFEVRERKFRMKPIRYQQIRQFHYDEVSLKSIPGLDPNLPKIEDKIKEALTRKVREMIQQARADFVEATFQPICEGDSGPKYTILEPQKVLIRLKVDYEGFSAINHQRFGSQFNGDVANPSEVLLLTKKRKEILRPGGDRGAHTAQGELQMLIAEGAEDEIHKIKIEDLVNETLAASKHSLTLLAETELAKALDDYIIRKIPNAIHDLVSESLERAQRDLVRNPPAEGPLARVSQPSAPASGNAPGGGTGSLSLSSSNQDLPVVTTNPSRGKSTVPEVDLMMQSDEESTSKSKATASKHGTKPATTSARTGKIASTTTSTTTTTTAAKKAASTTGKGKKGTKNGEDEDDELDASLVQSKSIASRSAPRQSARAAIKKGFKYVETEDEDDVHIESDEVEEEEEAMSEMEEVDEEEDDEEGESSEEEHGKKGKGKSKAGAAAGTTKSKPVASIDVGRKPAVTSRGKVSSSSAVMDIDDDEDDGVLSVASMSSTPAVAPMPPVVGGGKKRTLPAIFAQTAVKGKMPASKKSDEWD